MYYVISDTNSFILVDIYMENEDVQSLILCSGTKKEPEDVHQLMVKWNEYGIELYGSLMGIKEHLNKGIQREYFGEWVSINQIELDNIPLHMDITKVDSINELQHTLFGIVVQKLGLSNYKYVEVEQVFGDLF